MTDRERPDEPIEYIAYKRYNLFPIKPRYLTEWQKKKFERTDDLFLIVLLILSITLLAFSYAQDWQRKKTDIAQTLANQQQSIDQRDLDHDGRVTWSEERATAEQLQNLQITGYPCQILLRPGEPTKAVKKRISLSSFLAAATGNDANSRAMQAYFQFPKLMRRFLDKYTQPDASHYLSAVYLTHDSFLALVLSPRSDQSQPMICLEELEEGLEQMLFALPKE